MRGASAHCLPHHPRVSLRHGPASVGGGWGAMMAPSRANAAVAWKASDARQHGGGGRSSPRLIRCRPDDLSRGVGPGEGGFPSKRRKLGG